MSMDVDQRIRHHKDDHASSVDGARAASGKAPTQQLKLLRAWSERTGFGLTDEEAATYAGIEGGCPWKRCGELRAQGLIRWHPEGERREGSSGVLRKVSVITEMGRRELRAHGVQC